MARSFGEKKNSLKDIAEKSNVANATLVQKIDINLLVENQENEKIFSMDGIDGLAMEIDVEGLQQPITAYKLENGLYEISSGHRRYRATKKLGHKTIKAIVLDDVSEVEKARNLIGGNIKNRKLSPMDMARAIVFYEEKVLKVEDFKGDMRKAIVEKFEISGSQVHKYKVLLNLIDELQEKVEKSIVAYSAVSSVASLDKVLQKKIDTAFDDFIEENGEDNLTRDIATNIIKEIKNPVLDNKKNDIIDKQKEFPGEQNSKVKEKQDDIEIVEVVVEENNLQGEVIKIEREKEIEENKNNEYNSDKEKEKVEIDEDKKTRSPRGSIKGVNLFKEFIITSERMEEVLTTGYGYDKEEKEEVLKRLDVLYDLILDEKLRVETT